MPSLQMLKTDMKKIKESFLKAISKYDMIAKGDNVTVALSGGADSVALLLLFCEIKYEYSLNISAAHLNHGIRGEEARRDADFSENLCKKLNISFFSETVDVPALAIGKSLEETAREVRYAFLKKCAGSGKIATAHNLSDNAETVLLNLARGSGMAGLCGIPPVRDNIIRPLIMCNSKEIREFLDDISQEYMKDSTNECEDYSRNLIRHSVMPKLFEINEGLENNLLRNGDILRAEDAFLKTAAKQNTKDLQGLDKALLNRVIKEKLESSGAPFDFYHIEKIAEIVKNGQGRTGLAGGFSAQMQKGILSIYNEREENKKSFRLVECEKEKINSLLLKNAIDCDKIIGNLEFRSRREGDAFEEKGRGVTKTLKKLFNEAAVPPHLRDKLNLLSDDSGIVWIEGFGVSERAAVTKETNSIYLVEEDG